MSSKKSFSDNDRSKRKKKTPVEVLALAREVVVDRVEPLAAVEKDDVMQRADAYLSTKAVSPPPPVKQETRKKKTKTCKYGAPVRKKEDEESVSSEISLSQLVSDEEAEREYAALRIIPHHTEQQNAFIDLLYREQSVDVLCSALTNLALHQVSAAAEATRPLLKHTSECVRADAARLLAAIHDDSQALTEAAAYDPSKLVRNEAKLNNSTQASKDSSEYEDTQKELEPTNTLEDRLIQQSKTLDYELKTFFKKNAHANVTIDPEVAYDLVANCHSLPSDNHKLLDYWRNLKAKHQPHLHQKQARLPTHTATTPSTKRAAAAPRVASADASTFSTNNLPKIHTPQHDSKQQPFPPAASIYQRRVATS